MLQTRIEKLEGMWLPPAAPEPPASQGIVIAFVVYCPGRAENYLFYSWSGDGDPPESVHSWGCHQGAEYLIALAARYTVVLLHDPAHPYTERTPDIQIPDPDRPGWARRVPDLPAYGPEHFMDWAGYTAGRALGTW